MRACVHACAIALHARVRASASCMHTCMHAACVHARGPVASIRTRARAHAYVEARLMHACAARVLYHAYIYIYNIGYHDASIGVHARGVNIAQRFLQRARARVLRGAPGYVERGRGRGPCIILHMHGRVDIYSIYIYVYIDMHISFEIITFKRGRRRAIYIYIYIYIRS